MKRFWRICVARLKVNLRMMVAWNTRELVATDNADRIRTVAHVRDDYVVIKSIEKGVVQIRFNPNSIIKVYFEE